MSLMSYGDAYLKQRRLIQPPFTHKAVAQYRPIQDEEVTVLLHNLLKDPAGFDRHLHRYAASAFLPLCVLLQTTKGTASQLESYST